MKYKKLVTVIILISLLSIYFYKVVFLGRVLSATGSLFNEPPYASIAPIGWQHTSNSIWLDQTYQFYPFLHYARENIRQGHIPLWNPHIMMGAPFLADAQSAELYPVNIVFYTLPFRDAFAVSAFLRLFIAGLGMYLFVSCLGAEFIASLFSAVAFMFCAFNIVWLNHPHTNVSIFLPWMFFFTYRFMKTDRKGYFAGLALVTGIQFLGGHPETSAHILLVLSIYLLALSFWEYKDKKDTAATIRKTVYIGIAFILGFMIASPMLLPFISELFKSVVWAGRTNTSAFHLSLNALSALLMPNIYSLFVYKTTGEWTNLIFHEQSGYIGVIALILAGTAIVVRRKERHVLFFSFLALGALLVVYGIPPFFQAFNLLPLYNHMVNLRLLLVYQFSMIVLAGLGLNIIERIQPGKTDTIVKDVEKTEQKIKNSNKQSDPFIKFQPIKRLGFILTGTFVLLAVVCIAFLFTSSDTDPINHLEEIVGNFEILFIVAGLFIFSLSIYKSAGYKRTALVFIVIIEFLDLFYFGHNYNPQVPKEWVYPQAPAPISYMQSDRDLFRFIAIGTTFLSNSLMVYHVSDVRGYDFPVNKRYDRFFTVLFDQQPYPGPGSYLMVNSHNEQHPYLFIVTKKLEKIFQLINVKYVGDIYQLHPNNNYRQRVYLVHDIIPADTSDYALRLVDTHIDDLLKDSVIIEEKKNSIELASCEYKNVDQININSYQPDKVAITTFSKCQAILVLSDTYDSGWKVYVDGVRKPMLHTNYLFRGVFLEPSMHKVIFKYSPLSFTIGVILCFASLIGILVFVYLWGKDNKAASIAPL